MSKLDKIIESYPALVEQASLLVSKDVHSITAGLFGDTKAAEFSKEVVEFVSSDTFASELSNTVAEPRRGESEDQFVERAKDSMRSLLRKKFM
jgi:hypothetical protein